MSLDVTLTAARPTEVFEHNITHNLAPMALAAGLYTCIWRPEEIGATQAEQLIPLIEAGLKRLRNDPERFKKLNPENKWGDYDGIVRFAEEYLEACINNPDAFVSVSR